MPSRVTRNTEAAVAATSSSTEGEPSPTKDSAPSPTTSKLDSSSKEDNDTAPPPKSDAKVDGKETDSAVLLEGSVDANTDAPPACNKDEAETKPKYLAVPGIATLGSENVSPIRLGKTTDVTTTLDDGDDDIGKGGMKTTFICGALEMGGTGEFNKAEKVPWKPSLRLQPSRMPHQNVNYGKKEEKESEDSEDDDDDEEEEDFSLQGSSPKPLDELKLFDDQEPELQLDEAPLYEQHLDTSVPQLQPRPEPKLLPQRAPAQPVAQSTQLQQQQQAYYQYQAYYQHQLYYQQLQQYQAAAGRAGSRAATSGAVPYAYTPSTAGYSSTANSGTSTAQPYNQAAYASYLASYYAAAAQVASASGQNKPSTAIPGASMPGSTSYAYDHGAALRNYARAVGSGGTTPASTTTAPTNQYAYSVPTGSTGTQPRPVASSTAPYATSSVAAPYGTTSTAATTGPTVGTSGPKTGSVNQFSSDLAQPNAKKQRKLSGAESGCQCRKSRCLLLYCTCFSSGRVCVDSCGCQECANTAAESVPGGKRLAAIMECLSKNPETFKKGRKETRGRKPGNPPSVTAKENETTASSTGEDIVAVPL